MPTTALPYTELALGRPLTPVTDSGGASSTQVMSPNEPSVCRTTLARPLDSMVPDTKPVPESV